LFAIGADVAFSRDPQAFEKTRADLLQPGAVESDGLFVTGAAREVERRFVAAVGVGRLLRGTGAIVPLRIGWPGVDVAFIDAIVIGVKTVLHPFQM